MKPKKLPSGNWNVRVYVGTDEKGHSVMKSITAPTKKEAKDRAEQYTTKGSDMRVKDMVFRYIEEREAVISPNTHRGYIGMYNASIKDNVFGSLYFFSLTDALVQRWVSGIAKDRSPKTVKNTYGLFTAATAFFYPRTYFNVKLPQAMRPRLHTPTTAEVEKVLEYAKKHNFELYKAVLLSAVGMMRQGEIAALTADDIDFDKGLVSITKSLAKTVDGDFVIKPPKTESSNRVIRLPDFVISQLPREGRVVDMNPRYMTLAFSRMVKKLDVQYLRFHDLRHYAASIAASSSIGASVETIKARGGWATDSMMKRVYINLLEDEEAKDVSQINDFYTKKGW